jgi:hypothetical protein
MRLNLEKLDNHLKKLEEIRKIASDPEMMELLNEFLSPERGPGETEGESVPRVPGRRSEVSEVVKEVLQRSEHAGAGNSIGLWNRKKA